MTSPAYPPGPATIAADHPAPGWSSRAGRLPVKLQGFAGFAAAWAGPRWPQAESPAQTRSHQPRKEQMTHACPDTARAEADR